MPGELDAGVGRRRRRACWWPAQPTPITPARSVGLLVMDDDGTSHGLGRERPRAQTSRVRAIYPDGHARDDRRRAGALLGEGVRVRTATLDQPEHGLTDGGAGGDRRPDLVGPHRPRRGRRRDRRPRARRRARRHGPARAALRPLLQDLQAPAGHLLQPALAQRRRARAGLDRRAVAPDRGRRPAPDRDRRAGDVRRALRHPGARRARLHLLVRRRRGVPRRLLLHAAARAGSSTSAPATRSTPSTTTRTSSGCSPTRVLWAAPADPRRHPVPGSPQVPRGSW